MLIWFCPPPAVKPWTPIHLRPSQESFLSSLQKRIACWISQDSFVLLLTDMIFFLALSFIVLSISFICLAQSILRSR